jgi:quercetin dioxygenase-like cupin family protein
MNIDRFRVVFLVFLVATLGGLGVSAIGQTTAPAPVNVSLKAYPITVAAGDYELTTQVLDLPPGSGVPRHTHGGPVVVTVLSGEVTVIDSTGEKVYKTGDSWTEKAGDVHSATNRGTGTARAVASYLIPKGAARTTIVQ